MNPVYTSADPGVKNAEGAKAVVCRAVPRHNSKQAVKHLREEAGVFFPAGPAAIAAVAATTAIPAAALPKTPSKPSASAADIWMFPCVFTTVQDTQHWTAAPIPARPCRRSPTL